MKLNKKSLFIILSITLSALSMSVIDGFVQLPYLHKSLFKIFLFSVVPMAYFIKYKGEYSRLKELFVPRKSDLKYALMLGAGVYSVILLAYVILKDHIDLSTIRESLTANIGVNENNFVYVAIYISLINSLLEEFFFRGVLFSDFEGKH